MGEEKVVQAEQQEDEEFGLQQTCYIVHFLG
jgi:hypothetical protein